MKKLFISLLVISPFFTAQGLQIDDDGVDWKPMFTVVDTPGHVNFSAEVSRALAAQTSESHNEPLDGLFKSAYGDGTDLDNCQLLSPLFNPRDSSYRNDNTSGCVSNNKASAGGFAIQKTQASESYTEHEETDDAWPLSKSRGGHKRTQYEQHERGQYEKKEELRGKKYTAQRKKNHKAAYTQLKADQLRDIKKQVLKPGEYSSFKDDFAPSYIDSSLTKSTKKPKNAVKQSENKTIPQSTDASPYLFELFAQLENGLISPNVLRAELWNYHSDDTISPYGLDPNYDSDSNSCADEDLHEWVDIVNNWDNSRRREYGVKNLTKSAFKCLRNGQHEGNSILMGLWVMLDNLEQESDSSISHSISDDQPDLCATPMTRGEFFKAFRAAIAGTYRDMLDPANLFEEFAACREHWLRLDFDDMNEGSDECVPMSIAKSLEDLPYFLSQATQADVETARDEVLYGRLRGSALEKYLAAFAERLGEIVQAHKADADEHDAHYTNIPQEEDCESDCDTAWELSKSRGARKRLGYRQHEKNKHTAKKNMTRAQKAKAHNEKRDKAESAQFKSTEMSGMRKRILKPSEYDTLKNEIPDEASNQVAELTQAFDAVCLGSEAGGEQSTGTDTVDQALNTLIDNLFDIKWENMFQEWITGATDQELRDYIENNDMVALAEYADKLFVDESNHSHTSSSSDSETHGTSDDDRPLRQPHGWRENKTSSQHDADQSHGLTTSRSNDDDDSSMSLDSTNDDNPSESRKQLEAQARMKHQHFLQSIQNSEHISDDQSTIPSPSRSNDDDDGDSPRSWSSNTNNTDNYGEPVSLHTTRHPQSSDPVPFPTTMYITPRQSDEQLNNARRRAIEIMNRNFVSSER